MDYPRWALALAILLTQATLRADNIPTQRLVDLDGNPLTLPSTDARATAVIFIGTQCPISNRYIPQLNDLYKTDQPKNIDLIGVIVDPTITRKDVLAYRDQYKIAFPIIFDASGNLAKQFKPTHTPEAFLIDAGGAIRYQGRIDDSFAALGKVNQVVKSHDLVDAISAVLENQPITQPQTEVIGCPIETYDAKSPAKVTYTRDIAPILNANCVACHRDGQIAPFPLTSYTDAAKHAKLMSDVTQSHYMPPWKPAEDFGHFLGEHRLSGREIDLIKSWASTDAPQGNSADLPPLPKFASDWALGTPDMIVKMPEPFTVPAGGNDIYRAFVAPIPIPADCYVAGVEFKPGAPTVVHHCILYLDDSGAARKLDEAEPGPGYVSFGGPGFTPSGGLGGWAPGATPALLPDGIGRVLAKGSDVVFQMHYHPDGREHTDQSSIAIYFQKKPVKQILGSFMLATRDVNIPPGDANYTRHITVTLPTDMTLMGITPHMHLIGREMKVEATTPDKKQIPLIWINDWDFKWQGQYRFAEPLKLSKGTTISMTARYDNSDANPDNPSSPPKRVTHGEQTTDEMCICFISFLANNPTEAKQVAKQVTRQMVMETVQRKLDGGS
ncbi:MAG TPA: redoxin domain-containing protein [Tepidisphaeraceae bacterium]|nr:redoxin domain-containing protein [Tepidisphaeraceae bacterium]